MSKSSMIIMDLIIFLLFVSSAFAVSPHIPQTSIVTANLLQIERVQQPYFVEDGDGFDLHIHVYDNNSTPLILPAVTCLGHFYNASSKHVLEQYAVMDNNGVDLKFVLGANITNSAGYYAYIIHCNSTTQYGFIADFIEIGASKVNEIGGNPLSLIMLLPLLMGVLFMIFALLLNPEEHAVLRIFLMISSLLTYFGSSWIGLQTIIRYYGLPELQDSTTFMLWIFGSLIFVVISYFFIYAIYKGIKMAAQDKEERGLQ